MILEAAVDAGHLDSLKVRMDTDFDENHEKLGCNLLQVVYSEGHLQQNAPRARASRTLLVFGDVVANRYVATSSS